MKRGCLTALIVLVLSVGTLVVGYRYKYPDYSYRYRLTINIEVDGKIHSGSSVIEVKWRGGPVIGDGGPFGPSVKGQAALLDLGDRGVVVATLINDESYGPAKDGALGALWVAAEAFGNHSTVPEIPQLPDLHGKRDLALTKLPRLLWFSNPQDPMTARKLLVQEIPETFGPSARFAGASVEITSDPIVIDIRQKFAWLKPLEDKSALSNVIYLPNKLGISRYLFIGDAS
ncbi:hypothetical protein JQ596_15370 [Bradyrhizobium manausense]|uniref:hypothetical protein n=1 Tax=Bradyrhizobium TaxID=374 RepID=UPI001BA5AFF6|nr:MULTISPECIES: hypothetical protein [Bradyrhizobium]MBR0826927.1 hypothetical protein [Bradyrhizobium manausense]UVO32208.1 hypothetical protein KUF59_17030 [Bradyrhizobium arachidis]